MSLETMFTVRTRDFERFDEQASVEFFRELLWAEARRVGIPLSKITVSQRTKVGDFGVDASVQPDAGVSASNFIQDGLNSYQIKAGSSFRPWQRAEIRDELFGSQNEPSVDNLKRSIRECVENSGIYVLVCFGHDLTSTQRTDAERHLKEFLAICGDRDPRVAVWGAGQLIGFLGNFPSLALIVNGRARGSQFETYDEWANHKHMRKTFVPGAEQRDLVAAIRTQLREDAGVHIRVCGPAGIGKTKLVLEALREDDLKPLVVYFGAALQLLGSGLLFNFTRADSHLTAILVVDECSPRNRAELWNHLEHCGSRVKLITIYGDYDTATGLRLVGVPPLNDSQITEIFTLEYELPEDLARRWAPVCGGYPRVAHMVGWNLGNNPEDILRPPGTAQLWERFIEGGDNPDSQEVHQRRLVLQYLALFKRFGYGNEVRVEAEAIARMIARDDPSITWPRFQKIVRELRDRRILQGANTLYISPKLLHIKLWVDWWDTYGESTDLGDFLSLSPALTDWFFEMFEYAAGSEAASKTVQELLSERGPFQQNPDLLDTERGARLFLVLGEVEPEAAVRALRRTIGTYSPDELIEFRTGRRSVVWLLQHAAKWRHIFADAARLLLALGEAENESWSNNASRVFAELFSVSGHPGLSLTEAPPEVRFPIIEEALQAESKERRLLGIRACELAIHERLFGTISSDVRVFGKVPEPWLPATYGELFDVHRRAWRLLATALDVLSEDERQEAVEVLLRNMRHLGSSPNFVDMVMDTVDLLLARGYIDERRILETAIQLLHYDRERLHEGVRERWKALEAKLSSSDFTSLLKRYVGMSLIEDHYDREGKREDRASPKLEELAQQVTEQPDLLLAELEWLVTPDAVNGYQFGYLLGQQDRGFTLLENIVGAQRQALPTSGAFFLGGYLRALYEEAADSWEALLDRFATDSEMQSYVPELTFRVGELSDRAGRRLLDLVERDVFTPDILRMFRYGNAVRDLSEDVFLGWIQSLLDSSDHLAVYIALPLTERYYVEGESRPALPDELTLELLTHDHLVAETPKELAQGGIVESLHWESVARAYLYQYPERSDELASLVIQHFGEHRTIFADRNHGPQSVLATLIQIEPEMVWTQLTKKLTPPRDTQSFCLAQWLRGSDEFGGDDDSEEQGMLHAVRPDLVWQWVEGDVEERAWYVARFVPKGLYRAEDKYCWARELLIRYGDREDVRNELIANFSTEGWTGHASVHHQRKKERLLVFRRDEDNEAVRRWVDDYVARLDHQIERDRLLEERREF